MPCPIEPVQVTAGGLRMNVHTSGSGPVALLLHGFPDSGALWRNVTPRLVDAGYRVIAPDLRGFGATEAPVGKQHYAISRVVADLVALLDELAGPEPVHVIGHDWGAIAAWCLAMAHPERVRSNVVLSVGHPREYAVAGLEQKRKGLYTILWQLPGITESQLSRNDFASLRGWLRGHPDVEGCVQAMSQPGRLTAGLNWYRANLVSVLFGTWPQCHVPTLGIWSSGDRFLSEDQMKLSERRMAAPWKYVRIDAAGHWLPLEQPDRIAVLALDWFARADQRAAGR